MSSNLAVRLMQLLFALSFVLGANLASAQCTGDLTTSALFTQTNPDALPNQAVAYYRDAKGGLCEAGRFATGGSGSTVAIMNEGKNGVLLTGNCLLVTNAGATSALDPNGSVSSFRVGTNTLTLAGVVPSRGQIPISVTVRGNSGYVVNDLSNSINGFTFNPGSCAISERPNSLRSLDDPTLGPLGNPAQIQYTPDGKFLIVTNRQYPGDGLFQHYAIHVLAVGNDGLAGKDTINVSNGIMPYGFDFDSNGHLLVSNAGEPFLGFSSVSAYVVNSDGTLSVLNGGPVGSGQSGACWVSYTTHTAVPTIYVMSLINAVISTYTVGTDGTLTLQNAVAASTSNPVLLDGLDITLSVIGPADTAQYLYGINTSPVGSGGIVTYRVETNGALTQLGPIMTGPSAGFSGLAAR